MQTLIDMYGAESAGQPPILDLGNSSQVTLIGLPASCILRNAAGADLAQLNVGTLAPRSRRQVRGLGSRS